MIEKIIAPYIENVKKDLEVPNYQKSLLIWYAFKGQGTPRVQERLVELGVVVVMVAKNMTHLVQSLDAIASNSTVKKIEKKEFSNYIASIITNKMLIESSRDVTTIKIDLKLSTLKSIYLNILIQIFKTSDGKSVIISGFQATGITNAVVNARQGNIPSLDPYIQIIYDN